MRVLLDASEAYRNTLGIGRYSRSVIQHLRPLALETVYTPTDFETRRHAPLSRGPEARLKHFGQHLYLTQIAPRIASWQHRPDVFHSFSFFVPLGSRIPAVATFFDLAYFDLPHLTDRYWGAYARRMMPIFARQAAAIVTTSDVMKEAISERFQLPAQRIVRIYAGIDPVFRVIDNVDFLQSIRERYNVQEPFVLYVGGWYPTKNLPTLLDAFEGLDGVSLLLTGTPMSSDQQALAQTLRRLPNVKTVGHISDEDLAGLYNLAHVVVQPSRYEGFSLPVVEAMACGAPLIVSDLPILREITDGAALTFPPASSEALRSLLIDVLGSGAKRQEMQRLSLARSHAFQWGHAVEQLENLWQSLRI